MAHTIEVPLDCADDMLWLRTTKNAVVDLEGGPQFMLYSLQDRIQGLHKSTAPCQQHAAHGEACNLPLCSSCTLHTHRSCVHWALLASGFAHGPGAWPAVAKALQVQLLAKAVLACQAC